MATAAGSASLGDLIPKFSLSASKRLSSSDLLLGVSGSAFADSGRAPSTVLKRVGGGGAVCARVLGAVGGGAGDGRFALTGDMGERDMGKNCCSSTGATASFAWSLSKPSSVTGAGSFPSAASTWSCDACTHAAFCPSQLSSLLARAWYILMRPPTRFRFVSASLIAISYVCSADVSSSHQRLSLGSAHLMREAIRGHQKP